MVTEKDNEFLSTIIGNVKCIARNSAVHSEVDNGFEFIIRPEEIREKTGRERIKKAVLEGYKQRLEEEGYSVDILDEQKIISVFVPPILAIDSEKRLSLAQIHEQVSVINEINVREGYKLSSE